MWIWLGDFMVQGRVRRFQGFRALTKPMCAPCPRRRAKTPTIKRQVLNYGKPVVGFREQQGGWEPLIILTIWASG